MATNDFGKAWAALGEGSQYGTTYDTATGTWTSQRQFNDFVEATVESKRLPELQAQRAAASAVEYEQARSYQETGRWNQLDAEKDTLWEKATSSLQSSISSVWLGGGITNFDRFKGTPEEVGDEDEGEAVDYSTYLKETGKTADNTVGFLSEDQWNEFSPMTQRAMVNRAKGSRRVKGFLDSEAGGATVGALTAANRGLTTLWDVLPAGTESGANAISIGLGEGALGQSRSEAMKNVTRMFRSEQWKRAWDESLDGPSLGNLIIEDSLDPTDSATEFWERQRKHSGLYQASSFGAEVAATWYLDPTVGIGKAAGGTIRLSRGSMPLNEASGIYKAARQEITGEDITVKNPMSRRLGHLYADRYKSGFDKVVDYARNTSRAEFLGLAPGTLRLDMLRRSGDAVALGTALHAAANASKEARSAITDRVDEVMKGLNADDSMNTEAVNAYADADDTLLELTKGIVNNDPKAWRTLRLMESATSKETAKFGPEVGTWLGAIQATKTRFDGLNKEISALERTALDPEKPLSPFARWDRDFTLQERKAELEETKRVMERDTEYSDWMSALGAGTTNTNFVANQMYVSRKNIKAIKRRREATVETGTVSKTYRTGGIYGAVHQVIDVARGEARPDISRAHPVNMHDITSGATSLQAQGKQLRALFGYEAPVDEAVDSWTKAVNDDERYNVVSNFEETHVLEAAAQHFGVKRETIQTVYDHVVGEQNAMVRAMAEGQGSVYQAGETFAQRLAGNQGQVVDAGPGDDMVKIEFMDSRQKKVTATVPKEYLVEKMAADPSKRVSVTQNPNYYNPIDHRQFYVALKQNQDVLRELDATLARRGQAAAAELFATVGTGWNNLWKPFQLFRLGWPQRVLMDEWSRGIATLGFTQFAKTYGPNTAAVAFNAGLRMAGTPKAVVDRMRGKRLSDSLLNRVADPVIGKAAADSSPVDIQAMMDAAPLVPQNWAAAPNQNRLSRLGEMHAEEDMAARKATTLNAWLRERDRTVNRWHAEKQALFPVAPDAVSADPWTAPTSPEYEAYLATPEAQSEIGDIVTELVAKGERNNVEGLADAFAEAEEFFPSTRADSASFPKMHEPNSPGWKAARALIDETAKIDNFGSRGELVAVDPVHATPVKKGIVVPLYLDKFDADYSGARVDRLTRDYAMTLSDPSYALVGDGDRVTVGKVFPATREGRADAIEFGKAMLSAERPMSRIYDIGKGQAEFVVPHDGLEIMEYLEKRFGPTPQNVVEVQVEKPDVTGLAETEPGARGVAAVAAAQEAGLEATSNVTGEGMLGEVAERFGINATSLQRLLQAADVEHVGGKDATGAFYHGSEQRLPEQLNPRDLTPVVNGNMVGPGFYTTTDLEMAETYTQGVLDTGQGRVYSIRSHGKEGPAKVIDGDAPMTREQISGLRDFLQGLIDADAAAGQASSATGRAVRNLESYLEGSTYEVSLVDVMLYNERYRHIQDAAIKYFEDQGYVGLQHLGGMALGGEKHRVISWWHPEDIELQGPDEVEWRTLARAMEDDDDVLKLRPIDADRVTPRDPAPDLEELLVRPLENGTVYDDPPGLFYARKNSGFYDSPEKVEATEAWHRLQQEMGLVRTPTMGTTKMPLTGGREPLGVNVKLPGGLAAQKFSVRDPKAYLAYQDWTRQKAKQDLQKNLDETWEKRLAGALHLEVQGHSFNSDPDFQAAFNADLTDTHDTFLQRIFEKKHRGEGTIKVKSADGKKVEVQDAYAGPTGTVMKSAISSGSLMKELSNGHGAGLAMHRARSAAHKIYNPPSIAGVAMKRGDAKYRESVDYFRTWSDLLNRQVRNDPIWQKMLQGKHDDEITSWLTNTTAGEKVRQNLMSEYQSPELWVMEHRARLDQYLPDNTLRRVLIRRDLSPKELLDTVPEDLWPTVYGPDLEVNADAPWKQATKTAVDSIWNALGTMPIDKLARQPFFRAHYKARLESILGSMDSKWLDQKTLQKAENQAAAFAREQVHRTLYNESDATNLTDTLRFVSPFLAAQYEAYNKWLGIVMDRPETIGRFMAINQAAYNNFYVIDEDGKETKFRGGEMNLGTLITEKTGYHPTDRVVMQLPKWFEKTPLGKKLGFVGEVGIPIGSVNTVLQGETPFMPSLGPTVTIPMDMFLRTVDEDGSNYTQWNETTLGHWLFPIGRPQSEGTFDRIFEQMSPGYARRIQQMNGDTIGRLNTRMLVGREMTVDAREKGLPDPTAEEINKTTDWFWGLKIFTSIVSPVQTEFRPKHQHYIDEWRKYQEQYGVQAEDKFIAEHPEIPLYVATLYTGSSSESTLGVPPTAEGMDAWAKNKDLMAKDENNYWAKAMIAPEAFEGEYNSDAYYLQSQTQVSEANTSRLREFPGYDARINEAETTAGWYEYRALMAQVEEGLKAAGATSIQQTSRPGVAQLAAYKSSKIDELRAKNNAWAEDYATMERTADLRMAQADKDGKGWVWDGRFDKRQDIQGFRSYLMLRRDVAEGLDMIDAAGGSRSLQAQDNGNTVLRDYFYGQVSQMVRSNPQFGEFYARYLSSDSLQSGSGGY